MSRGYNGAEGNFGPRSRSRGRSPFRRQRGMDKMGGNMDRNMGANMDRNMGVNMDRNMDMNIDRNMDRSMDRNMDRNMDDMYNTMDGAGMDQMDHMDNGRADRRTRSRSNSMRRADFDF